VAEVYPSNDFSPPPYSAYGSRMSEQEETEETEKPNPLFPLFPPVQNDFLWPAGRGLDAGSLQFGLALLLVGGQLIG
jgi:hypothetical protein